MVLFNFPQFVILENLSLLDLALLDLRKFIMFFFWFRDDLLMIN